MTFDEFSPAFLLLEMHFESRKREPDEEDLIQRSWFSIFEGIDVAVWEAAAQRWIATQKWMPKPVELREVCFEEATRIVGERTLRDLMNGEMKRTTLPESAERREELRALLRRWRDTKQLKPPAPADHPLLDDDDGR